MDLGEIVREVEVSPGREPVPDNAPAEKPVETPAEPVPA